jgi:hypothetical protein
VTGTTRVGVNRQSDNSIQLFARNSAEATLLNLRSTSTVTAAGGWVHVYACIDLADTGKRKIYFNGVSDSLSVTTYTDDTIDMADTDYRFVVATATGLPASLATAAYAELWFNDSYLDSPSSFASGGKPISLGSDGSTPTGSAPVFYLKGDGNGFNVNSGTGGNFTITGSLGTTTPP